MGACAGGSLSIVALVALGCSGAILALHEKDTSREDAQTPSVQARTWGTKLEIRGSPSAVSYCLGQKDPKRPSRFIYYECYDPDGRPTTETIKPP